MQGIKYYFNSIYQNIEIKKCNDNVHASKAHFHNEVSIGLIDKGKCELQLQGKSYELSEKTILIIPPNVVHKCNPQDYRNWNFKMLYINKQWLKSSFSTEFQYDDIIYKKLDDNMYFCSNEIFNKIENTKIDIEYESSLLANISSLIKMNNEEFCKINFKDTHFKKIEAIKDYINKNYLNNITLDDLSQIANLSKYYIVKQFENCYGVTPHQYLINLRINNGKELLKNNSNLTEVALKLGFYDQSHFTRYFKEYTGLTPMKYVK